MELPKFDPVTKIWQGAITPYPFGQKGVAQICYENMKANLQHVCQVIDVLLKWYQKKSIYSIFSR